MPAVSAEALLQTALAVDNSETGEGAVEPRPKKSDPVEKALRNLMFSTATVPLTDACKMRLRAR